MIVTRTSEVWPSDNVVADWEVMATAAGVDIERDSDPDDTGALGTPGALEALGALGVTDAEFVMTVHEEPKSVRVWVWVVGTVSVTGTEIVVTPPAAPN